MAQSLFDLAGAARMKILTQPLPRITMRYCPNFVSVIITKLEKFEGMTTIMAGNFFLCLRAGLCNSNSRYSLP